MFRSALVVLSGNSASSLLTLVRNLLVARMIPVADYGIAATFAVAMALIEMASAFGLQQQIIQAREGDDSRFQAGLQGFQLLRGLVSGAILFLIARPFANFMGVPEVAWAYQVLALVPVLNAAQHFDIFRLSRHMRFAPMILTKTIPAALALAAVWPLAIWLGDWQVMLWTLLLQAAAMAVTSHLVAERRYRLLLDREIMAGALRFGWPILVNSALMFLVFQGDKVIVGRALGMEALAVFALGVTLTLTPTLVFSGSAQSLFLPRLSTLGHAPEDARGALDETAYAAFRLNLLFGNLFVLGVVLLGPLFVHFALGQKYAALAGLLVPMAVLQCLRGYKGGPSTIALAFGQTSNPMIANLFRVGLLPLGYWVAVTTGDILLILLTAVLGELLAFAAAFLLTLRLPFTFPPGLRATIATSLFFLATALAWGVELLPRGPAAAALGLAFALSLWPMRSLLAHLPRRARPPGGA